jgi:glycosyltransferase involved in cell wall biosynthesis
MRVIHINYSSEEGGAARAAFRIHNCLRQSGIDSRMWVTKGKAGDWTVESCEGKLFKAFSVTRNMVASTIVKALKTSNSVLHSPAILPSHWVTLINASDADIAHLHWVQGEMLSVADIARIEKPVVWTLHDMWPFCGAEHYTDDKRWREGYISNNRPTYESGFDLNRWTWQRKRRLWQQPRQLVAPSKWLADCVQASALMRDWPISVVSHPIDVVRWSPIDQTLARGLLGLPQNVPLLLFGAIDGAKDPRKGFDLLVKTFSALTKEIPDLQLVVFGQLAPRSGPDLGLQVHYVGHLHDDISLRVLYSAADVFALSSRQDNFPLTCMESLTCGTPVVAFDSSGLSSMIEHGKTGYLARAFDTDDFVKGIRLLIEHANKNMFRESARAYAKIHFSPQLVSKQYVEIYERLKK